MTPARSAETLQVRLVLLTFGRSSIRRTELGRVGDDVADLHARHGFDGVEEGRDVMVLMRADLRRSWSSSRRNRYNPSSEDDEARRLVRVARPRAPRI